MNTKLPLFIVLALLLVALGVFFAYTSQVQSPEISLDSRTNTSPGSAQATQDQAGKAVALWNHATLGKYMTGKNGITLYTFTQDGELQATCSGQCAEIWPPFLAGEEARENLASYSHPLDKFLNLIEREDGLVQFAFGNSPLYYYSGDKKAGDVNGQGINNAWFIVQPSLTDL